MANTTGWNFGFTALWGMHALSMIAIGVGLVFLIVWAVKHLHAGQLKNWGIGLLAAGTIACLFTVGVKGSPWMGFGSMSGERMGMKCPMMEKMENGHGSDGMMDMSMKDMSAMLEGETGDEFDKAFIEGMIPHHQGAIEMAEAALKNAKHEEIKNMAREIISAQQREIDQMKEWQRSWGYEQ